MEKILIIGPFNEPMKAALNERLADKFEMEYITSRDDYDKLRDADYVILRTLNLTADDIATMDKCKLIQRWGAGYDTVDIQAAGAKKIQTAICFGTNAVSVAEMAVALTLAVYRNIVPLTNGINGGVYERTEYGKVSYTINGKTCAIIGAGNIGRKVGAIYQAFGAKVIYYDAFRMKPEMEEKLGFKFYPMEEIWDKCDIMSLHVPLLPTTERMINRENIAKMKTGALIINTAREELIDYDALKEALESGKLCGAGIDALEEETIANLPIKGLKNVAMTAHLGGTTADSVGQLAERCAQQVIAVSNGERLVAPHLVNGDFLK